MTKRIMEQFGIEIRNGHTGLLHEQNNTSLFPADYCNISRLSVGTSTTSRSSLYYQHYKLEFSEPHVDRPLDLSRRSHSLGSSQASSTPSPHKTNSSYGSDSPAVTPTKHQQQSPQLRVISPHAPPSAQTPPSAHTPPSAQTIPSAQTPPSAQTTPTSKMLSNNRPHFQYSQTYNSENYCAKNAPESCSPTIPSPALLHPSFANQRNYSIMSAAASKISLAPTSSVSINQNGQQEPTRSFKSLPRHPLELATKSEFGENWAKISNVTAASSGLIKDAAYLERRRKNNAAAKKSRDRHRIKEDQLAVTTQCLQEEKNRLKWKYKDLIAQNAILKEHLAITRLEISHFKAKRGLR